MNYGGEGEDFCNKIFMYNVHVVGHARLARKLRKYMKSADAVFSPGKI